MRKLILLFLVGSAFATTTVTGHVSTLGTTAVTSSTFVRFWLRGCGGNQPRINGTSIIAPSQGGTYFIDFPVNASGNVSGTLYSTRDSVGTGNGDIECGGSQTSVWYGMVVFNSGKAGPETPVHAKSSGTLDVSNVTPITTSPVVNSPTGDSTYARLDGGNTPFSGSVTFAANVVIPGSNTLSATTLSDYSVAGFSKLNSGFFTTSSLVTKGALDLYNNATGIIFRNGVFNSGTLGKTGTLQAGDTASGTATWLANSVYNLPDLAQGGVSNTSGFLYGASAAKLNASVGNCVFGSGVNTSNNAGILENSGFGCNTHIIFPTLGHAIEWQNGANTLIVQPSALTGNRTIVPPDASGTLLVTGNGISPLQTQSAAGCATAASAGATCDTTLTWATAFGDTSYKVTCGGNTTTSGVPVSGGVNTKAAGSIKFRTVALTAAAAQFTNVECIAVHD